MRDDPNPKTPLYLLQEPEGKIAPILISVPHSGLRFPESELDLYTKDIKERPEDTDWYVDQLYDFAPSLGISMIVANYSRYVVDLNRDPESKPLYNDGRQLTSLFPLQTFHGEPIYAKDPDDEVKSQRLKNYYFPYYDAVNKRLTKLRGHYDQVLFFDAHSIARLVPNIRKEPFPDMILGNDDGRTCSEQILQIAQSCLMHSTKHRVNLNDPFKGGYLTRFFGNPEAGIHALQLEMANDLYLTDDGLSINNKKCDPLKDDLIRMFDSLIRFLRDLNRDG